VAFLLAQLVGSQLSLQVCIAHHRLLSLRREVPRDRGLLSLGLEGCRLSATMEADIPSVLDIPDYCARRLLIASQLALELDNSLVRGIVGLRSADGIHSPRVPKILGVGIVDASELAVHVAVLLHGVGDVAVRGGIECGIVEVRCKARAKIGDPVNIPGVQCDLSLHTDHLIASIEGLVL